MPGQALSVDSAGVRIIRNLVTWLLGTPDRIEGSLNDPRDHGEHGVIFNEKWSYNALPDDPAGARARIVYWHRYDFTGTVIREGAGAWTRDEQLEQAVRALAARASASPCALELQRHPPLPRRYFVNRENPPVTPSNSYRPVSEFEGQADLGGRVQSEPSSRPR